MSVRECCPRKERVKQETIAYFKTLTQYDTLRITASHLGADGTTIGYRCKGYEETWGWTEGGQPLSRDFEISGFADEKFDVTVCYGSSGSGSGFAVKLELIEAPDYNDPETWFSDFNSDVTHTKAGYNSYDFTRSADGGVLSFKKVAISWLVKQGYTKIRVTYIPKAEESAPNMTIYPDGEAWNTNPLWATKDLAQTKEFDISGGTAFSLHVVKTPSITEFNIKFKAINDRYNDFDSAENWFDVYNSDVTREQVSENGFDFERSNDGGILSFKQNALTWLVKQGYVKIEITYFPKTEDTASNMTIYPDGEAWNTNPLWATKDNAQTKEFDITSGTAFSLHVVKTPSITEFNIKFKAISGLKEVTVDYNVNGVLDKTETVLWKEENFAANMPTVSKDEVKTFGYEYDGKLYKDVASVFAAIGTPEDSVAVNVVALRLETQDGAEIRDSGKAGLRFTSIVGKSDYFSVYGMILTVRSNVDTNSDNPRAVEINNFDKESLAAASLKWLEISSTDSGLKSYDKDGNTVFNLVLTDISDDHRTTQYIARTYVTVEYEGGSAVTFYSDVDFENNARAPHDVGYSALDNAELSGITEDQKAFIKENYLSKESITLTAYYGPAVGAYMENGTLVSNVADGAVYKIATVDDVKAFFDAGFTFICGDDADYLTYRSAGHEADSGYSETDTDGNYANSDAIKLLNLVEAYCDAYDVAYENAKVLIKLGYLEGAMEGNPIHTEDLTKTNITKFYNHLKTFKCFGGFILRDEPRGYMAESYNYWYGWLVNELGVYRDGYMLHGSLLGMGAAEVHVAGSSDEDENYSATEGLTEEQFTTYVEKYIAGLTDSGEEYLSFDYYPFTETITRSGLSNHTKTYGIRGQYFQNLEIFSRLAKENGFKKGLCVQSTGFYNKNKYDDINKSGLNGSYTYYGNVSEEMLTYQLYTALAYGYERISYFTYMQPMNQTTAEYFVNAPYMWVLQSDGSYKAVATEVYESVKNANAEITAMAKRVAGYKWIGTVYSAGTTAAADVFNGTTSYTGGILASITSSYDAVAGCMKDENGRFGFMVVNSDDPRNARTNVVTLTFGAGYKKVEYIENGVKKTADLTDGKITLDIGAGKGVFVTPAGNGAAIKITTPANGESVYPYQDNVKNYLETDDADVGDYLVSGQNDAFAPVTICWENTFVNVTAYKVEYSVNRDFSEALVLEFGPYVTSAELYNLYKATEYFVRVTAIAPYGEVSAVSSFTTSELGPRIMKIDGIYNVRDLGGYITESGERTVQGRFFRGGALSDEVNHWYPQASLTEEGKAYMRDVLGIKTDFDLRSQAENLGLTESPIPEATLEYYGVGGYTDAFTNANFAKVFTALADESRYPVYMHCTGGADRTGTVSFLINALCGVDEVTLIKDYEMTSFSIYGERNSKKTEYNFSGFLAQLKTYEGDTLSEKTENYMKSIGVSEIAIYNIKAIMFGKETKALPVNISAFDKGVTLNSSTTKATGENVIGYNGATGEVTISSSTGDNNGGTYIFVGSYGFYIRGGSFRVAQVSGDGYAESSPRKENGSLTTAKLQSGVTIGMSLTIKDDTTITATVYVDGAQNFTYDFTRVSNEIASDSAYMSVAINTAAVTTLVIAGETAESNISAFTNGVTLNSSTTKATGENVIGYNGATGEVTISNSTGDNNGGTYIFVGSYGFYIRGGSFRVAQVSGDGYAESSPRKENGSLTTAKLQSGVTIGMSLTIKDDTTITAMVYVDGVQNFTYDFTRVSNEIASDSAYMSVAINTAAVTTLVIAGA